MANAAENKSFCEVLKYVINTRPHCPKLMNFMYLQQLRLKAKGIPEINKTPLSKLASGSLPSWVSNND
jgi:hypothetical protein